MPQIAHMNTFCRLCANKSENLTLLYTEEGLSTDLVTKIDLYVRIKIFETDTLPLRCCNNCTDTVNSWHRFVTASLEAQTKLRELQTTAKQEECSNETSDVADDSCDVKLEFTGNETEEGNVKPKQQVYKRRRNSNVSYKFFCDICEHGYTRKFDMMKHRKLKHPDVASLIEPEICQKSFANDSELKNHLEKLNVQTKRSRRKQTDIVPEFYCDLCNKGFTRKSDMLKHRKTLHPDSPAIESCADTKHKNRLFLEKCKITDTHNVPHYKCEHCDRLFQHPHNFICHQRIHTGVRPYFCHICGKNFRVSGGLHRHIKEHHYGLKPFTCDVCGKKFAAKTTLDEHQNIHTDTRPFVCDACGKAFKQKASLHTHKLFHTDVYRFPCETCGKKYRRRTDLKLHTYLHTGHKPNRCEVCGAMFRLKQDLKRHLKVHDKLSECVCSECGLTFTQERYLKNHRRTHRV